MAPSALISLVVTLFLLESSAQSTYNVGVMIAEPYTCRESNPCWRSGRKPLSLKGCPRNGIKTVSGECVHGYMPDLLNILEDRLNVTWHVTLIDGPLRGKYEKVLEMTSKRGLARDLCSGSPCDIIGRILNSALLEAIHQHSNDMRDLA